MRKTLLLLLTAFAAIALWSQRTSRRPRNVVVEHAATAGCDTVTEISGAVCLSGFDKPLRSRKETFFATNTGSRTIIRMAITLDYFDLAGRQLHSRHLPVGSTIEPGQTRSISIPSWDIQQSFYYTLSEKPKRVEQATPFNVAITVDTLFIEK